MKQAILMMLLLAVTSLFAQEEKLLNMQDCINLALKSNYDLLVQKNEVDKVEYDSFGSWQGFMPRLDVSASGGQAKTGPTRIFGQNLIGYDTTSVPPQAIYEAGWQDQAGYNRFNYQLAVNINWTIFDGLRTFYNIKRSAWNEEASKHDFQSRINSTIQQVRVAYFDVLKYQKLVEVNQLATDRSMEQLHKQVLAFQIGSATRLDTLKAYVTYNNDRVTLINSANSLKQSQYSLNQVMGTDTGQRLKVASIDKSNIPALEDFQVLFDFVKQRNPDLKGSEARVNAANQYKNQSISPFIPSFSLNYQYARRQENADKVFYDFDNYDLNWSTWFGWQVSWNLFNGFGDYVTYQKAKIDLRNAEVRENQSRNNVYKNLRVAYDNYKSSLEIIEINLTNVESAKEDYRLASEKKAVGSATILDVIDSQVSLTRAEQSLVEAYYNALKARAQIDELIGTEYKLIAGNN